jgi:PIN domain nuclease of toxin-antitoxin system
VLPLPITFAHAVRAGRLPPLHGDPFDRMLVAQAQLEGLAIVTRDRKIARYDVAVVPA